MVRLTPKHFMVFLATIKSILLLYLLEDCWIKKAPSLCRLTSYLPTLPALSLVPIVYGKLTGFSQYIICKACRCNPHQDSCCFETLKKPVLKCIWRNKGPWIAKLPLKDLRNTKLQNILQGHSHNKKVGNGSRTDKQANGTKEVKNKTLSLPGFEEKVQKCTKLCNFDAFIKISLNLITVLVKLGFGALRTHCMRVNHVFSWLTMAH